MSVFNQLKEKIDEESRQRVKDAINDRLTEKGIITFKFEGVIGHFCVESLSLAKQLLDGARLAGLRNSGIGMLFSQKKMRYLNRVSKNCKKQLVQMESLLFNFGARLLSKFHWPVVGR